MYYNIITLNIHKRQNKKKQSGRGQSGKNSQNDSAEATQTQQMRVDANQAA